MYLKELNVENFRNLEKTQLQFHKGINTIIGENNTGKTAIFDVLQICFGTGDRYRRKYIHKSDFYIDSENPEADLPVIRFDLVFQAEEEEMSTFRELSVPPIEGELHLHHEYYYEKINDVDKLRYKIWGGENKGQQISPEVLELINHIYLGALRDASRELKPVRGNKLGELYSKLNKDIHGREINGERREQMAGKIKDALHNDTEWDELISIGRREINKHLEKTSILDKEQKVQVDFLPFEFTRLVEYLRIQLPIFDEEVLEDEFDQKFFDIYQNGLGYNNLIFTATILSNLKIISEVDPSAFIALIIEEPEAHLHPQLQKIFFKYLNELNDEGFQVFISSHSPTITAKANLDSLIILQQIGNGVEATSLSELDLSPTNKNYLTKFLDVTESQLFFANHVLLVEGISEALLLQLFSEMIDEVGTYNLERNGVEIVNIGGVAFEHFARLFNSSDSIKRLKSKCCVLTDSDPDAETGAISGRAINAQELEGGNLIVKLAEKTFEFDLFIEDEQNQNIMRECFGVLHPTANDRIEQGSTSYEYAINFLEKVEANKAKSRLAHALAIKLENDANTRARFKVPSYIESAIKSLLE